MGVKKTIEVIMIVNKKLHDISKIQTIRTLHIQHEHFLEKIR